MWALGRRSGVETLRPRECCDVLLGVLLGRAGLLSWRVGVRRLPGVEGASACSRSAKVQVPRRVMGRAVSAARARRTWRGQRSVFALGRKAEHLYSTNSLWESIRVVRSVVGHDV